MEKLVAESFASDSKVLHAKQLILEALEEHQAGLTGIRPADPERIKSYSELISEFGELRGGNLYYSYLGSGIGRGPLVELADGSVKYDFISGIGVHHWGHSHPAVISACIDAALRDTVLQGNLQQNTEGVELARIILSGANRHGAGMSHCFFSTSGAMANENALKIIFQKKSPANRLLAFEGCFAGRTLALSQVTDRPAYRSGLPPTITLDYIPFFNADKPTESVTDAVRHLKRYLARYPGQHAGMIFELIQGEGGFRPGTKQFFYALMEVLKENDIPVMVDEIQTFGRTTELFAFQSFELNEFVDVVTIGKMAQVCATLFTDDFTPKPGLLSQTFTSGTSALFASKVIISSLLEDGYLGPDGTIARLREHMVKRLSEIEERHPDLIEGPFGMGAMIVFTPFKGDAAKVKEFLNALFDAGVIAFSCGTDITRVRFLLPVGAVTFDHIDEVASIVERTLEDVSR